MVMIFKESILKVDNEFKTIISNNPTLLGLDGKPSKDSLDAIKFKIIDLLRTKAASPTILQHLDNPELADREDQGASFKVTHLIGATVTNTLLKVLPGLDPNSAHMLVLMSLIEIANPTKESLYAAVDQFMKVDNFDENGNPLLISLEKRKNLIETVLGVLIKALIINQIVIIPEGEEGSIQMTELGYMVINHLTAVDALMNIMEHSQIQNAKEDLPKQDSQSEGITE
jgi:hypothetical protein